MDTELQSVIDRLDHVERQARGWKLLVVVAMVIAAASIALPILYPRSGITSSSDRARYSVVEANRFLLRDADGVVAGGLEVRPDGTIRFVLGNRTTAAAFLEVQRNGVGQLTLRGPDGDVRAALTTTASGAGEVVLKDGTGQTRFRAP